MSVFNNLNWLLAAAAVGLLAVAAVLILHWLRLLLRPRGVAAVVSDTSVITNLAAVGLLHLLYEVHAKSRGAIYVPPWVYREMRRKSKRNFGREAIVKARWIVPLPVANMRRVQTLLQQYDKLHRGEAEAIILATEISAELLLIDETLGRKVAEDVGIKRERVTGLIAVLTIAKRRGLIAEVKPILDVLRAEPFKFRIAQRLYNDVLRDIGEL